MATMTHPGGRPRKWDTPEDLQQDIDAYFNRCKVEERPTTYQGLANILEIDRKTLLNYSKKEEYFPIVKKARDKIAERVEELMLTESKAGQIFYSKNNMGYEDRSIKETEDVTAREAWIAMVKAERESKQ